MKKSAFLLPFLLAAPLAAQGDGIVKIGKELLSKRAPSIVTIRVVLKLEIMGQTREQRLTAHGCIANETGLILASIDAVDPAVNVRGRNGQAIPVTKTPTDLKIVFEAEEKEHDAFLVGKDSKLGLSFLQLKKGLPEKRKSQVLSFRSAKSPEIGSTVLIVNRLAKGFDYAPVLGTTRVLGRVKKPRKAWIIGGGLPSGLPCFNLMGELVGVSSRIAASGTPRPQGAILRGKIVASAVKTATKQAKKLEEERVDSKDGDDKESGDLESGEVKK